MQGSLQIGPTLYNDPEGYAQHLRETGRAHLADDLRPRLAPDNGATQSPGTRRSLCPRRNGRPCAAQFARHMAARQEQR